ncbi:MAG: SH3 domain-containing protein, partial [Chloroflexota bacterium]
MRRTLPIIALLFVLSLFAACTTAPAAVILPTLAVLPTASATPTATDTPTSTPLPTSTLTPSPTDTDTPTATDTSTATATATFTETLTPSATPITPTLTASLTPTWTVSPTASPYPATSGDASISMTDQQLVNLRGGPGFAYDPLQALATGTPLFVIGKTWDNQWYQVRLMNGQEGWVYSLYLVIWIDTNRVVVTYAEPTQPPTAAVNTFVLGGHIMDSTGSAFGLAHSAGMTWVKVQHRFYVGQSAQDVLPDIQAAHQNGFRILLGIVGDQAQMRDFNRYVSSYAAFVAEAAAAGADAIEVWNEPNIDHEWPVGSINGANYTEMLAASYTAIKARAPATIVISAAPAPTGFFGVEGCGTGGCNDDIFLKQMAFAGAQNYLDCVGLHHNDGIVSPLETTGDPRGNYPTNYLMGVIGRVPPEFNGKPICFTEVGYLSPEGYGNLPGNFAWAQNTTIAEQAQWLVDAVHVAKASGRVEMMIVW